MHEIAFTTTLQDMQDIGLTLEKIHESTKRLNIIVCIEGVGISKDGKFIKKEEMN